MEPERSRSIGFALREARERQHLTLAECMERTRIRRKYLEALENEEFDMLPEPAYARGFLRTYAAALGVDPQRLIEAYDETVEPEQVSQSYIELRAREAPRSEVRRSGRERRSGMRGLIWAAVGVTVVVIAAFFASRGLAAEAGAVVGAYFSR